MSIQLEQDAFDYNREIFNKAVKGNKIVVVKTPRQSGGTTFLAEHCMDNKYTNFLYLSPKMASGREFLSKCRTIGKTRDVDHIRTVSSYDNILKFNKSELELDGKVLIIDQCAFIKEEEILNKINFENFDRVIIMSTPTKSSGYFYNKYNNVSFKGISFRTPYNLNDPQTVEVLLDRYGSEESFKQEVLGMFYTKKDEIQTVTLNNVKIEKLLYITMIERIRQIEEKTYNAYTLTPSDYIRELIKADIKENILVDLFFSEE